ncbi:MAG: hypothetical protein WCW52_04300 [Elusimicrobiales bacterium]|jgi:type II secretory pathway pseudopilin PulG
MPRSVFKKRPAQTLIEVVVATMIAGLTTVAVFSVVLSSFVSQKKSDRKELAAMTLKRAQQTLQAYVSAVPAEGAYSVAAGGHWPADAYGGWALAQGAHNIVSLMPAALCPPGACTFVYTVTDVNCGFGIATANACKTVVFNMTYPD